MTVRTIHSGRWPDLRKESTTFSRLADLICFCLEVDSFISTRNSSASDSRSSRSRRSRTASAPIFATKASAPWEARVERNSSSERSCRGSSSVEPGSMTMYRSK